MRRLLIIISSITGLAGCSAGQDYMPPELSFLTSNYQNQANQEIDRTTSIEDTTKAWWLSIDDPILHSLIEKGLSDNLDLEAAMARIEQARAKLGLAESDFLPRMDAAGNFTTNELSREGIQGANPFIVRSYEMYQTQANASWELDIFGRISLGRDYAQADLNTSRMKYHAASISLASKIGQEYALYRAIQQQLTINQQRGDTQRRALELNHSRFTAGISPETDVTQAQALLSETEAALPELEFQLAQSGYRLDILTAQPPGSTMILVAQSAIPEAPAAPYAGVPSDLLRKRPDILAAEAELHMANAAVGLNEAEYLPKFSLIGRVGLEALKNNDLFVSDARFLTAGPSVTWRLLEFWRIDDEIAQAKGRYKEVLAQYKHTVLQALAEVETALTRYEKKRETLKRQEDNVTAQQRNLDLLQEQYKQGIITFLNVSDAERAMQNALDSQALAKRDALNAYILLTESLGGYIPELEQSQDQMLAVKPLI